MKVENQNNLAYVENFLRKGSRVEKEKMYAVLDKYGDNRWWLSNDAETLVKNQIQEQFLIVEFNRFKKALEEVLARPVKLRELSLGKSFDQLKEEVMTKISMS